MNELNLDKNKLYYVHGEIEFGLYYFGENNREDINEAIIDHVNDCLGLRDFSYGINEINDISRLGSYVLKSYPYTDNIVASEMTIKQLILLIAEQNRKETIARELDEKQIKLNI